MKNFARIYNASVVEIVSIPDDYNIEDCFTADIVAALVSIDGLENPPACGWTYDGEQFHAPVPVVPTVEEIQSANSAVRDALLAAAALAIAPLQDAIDLDMATSEEQARLTLWKQYRVAVNRVDLTTLEVTWPAAPAG